MNYMRVDVGFPGHEKAIRAGGDAIWMWLTLKAYAKEHGTDGLVPGVMIGRLTGPPPSRQRKLVARLVEVRLVDQVGADFQIHDYLDWEESAAEAEARRGAARVRKQRYDARHRGNGNAVTNGVTNAVVTEAPNGAKPNQTKPNQTKPPVTPPPPDTPDDGVGKLDPFERRLFAQPQLRDDVRGIWGLWCKEFSKPNAKLDHRRAQVIADRLDEGATPEAIEAAFRGAHLDEWVASKGFQVSLILGDRERFEHLQELGTGLQTTRRGHGAGPVQATKPQDPDPFASAEIIR